MSFDTIWDVILTPFSWIFVEVLPRPRPPHWSSGNRTRLIGLRHIADIQGFRWTPASDQTKETIWFASYDKSRWLSYFPAKIFSVAFATAKIGWCRLVSAFTSFQYHFERLHHRSPWIRETFSLVVQRLATCPWIKTSIDTASAQYQSFPLTSLNVGRWTSSSVFGNALCLKDDQAIGPSLWGNHEARKAKWSVRLPRSGRGCGYWWKTTLSQILSYPDKRQGCNPAENHIGKSAGAPACHSFEKSSWLRSCKSSGYCLQWRWKCKSTQTPVRMPLCWLSAKSLCP